MKSRLNTAILSTLALSLLLSTPAALAANIEYLTAKPLVDGLKSTALRPVRTDVLWIPTITWAGDISTIFADQTGAFQQEGLKNVKLFKEDNFTKQVQDCLDGKTPYVRGTMGMINSAAEAFEKAGTKLVVIYQLTWSTGGDCMVVRPGIKSLTDLKEKTIALQLYGPHMDYVNTIVSKAGLDPSKVKYKWLRELTTPLADTHGKDVDTVSAFQHDPSLDACMVIAPDAGTLTNGGAEGSVKGAKTLFTSASASRIICDVYAVRQDYFDAHPGEVKKFVHALMVGQERFESLKANKDSNLPVYNELIKRAAVMQYGDDGKQAKSNAEGSLGDCTWVGFNGNVQFFTGKGTSRNFAQLTKEIQNEFKPLGLMRGPVTLPSANWDYTQLTTGLKNADVNALPKPILTPQQKVAVQEKATRAIAAEPTKWQQDGTLYSFEVRFKPNVPTFDIDEYKGYFKQAYNISQPMAGALVFVEGHSAPTYVVDLQDQIAAAKAAGKSPAEVAVLTAKLADKQRAANKLGLDRAKAVCNAYIQYCKQSGLPVDESQFQPVSMGANAPKYRKPSSESEFYENFRVVFRIKEEQAEPTTFQGK